MATDLVFLPGESHGQRSLADYSPWGRKELDTTERLSTHRHNLNSHTRHTCLGVLDSVVLENCDSGSHHQHLWGKEKTSPN